MPNYPGAMSAKSRIRVARVYDDSSPEDGQRILVDRVWPRGFRKDDPRVGTWCKDVAPSNELRGWYGHKPERFVTATRDVDGSQAAVLAKLLKRG
jgi:uncharacterized protein YeaO (DUF488 family)